MKIDINKLNRSLPAIITLLAGTITCIITMMIRYPVKEAMLTIFLSMVLFYIIGSIARAIIGSNIAKMEEREAARLAEEKRLEEEEKARLQAEEEQQEAEA